MNAKPEGRAPHLVAEGVAKRYGGRTVVDVDRLEVAPGRTLALLGPSGAGKSTLMRIIGLLEAPDEGRVTVDGERVSGRDDAKRIGIGVVFQQPFLFRGTVEGNVGYGLKLRGTPRRERVESVMRMLERVGLQGRERHPARLLSGGEARRVALARALVLEPRVLLMDEPLASLDPLIKTRLMKDFGEIIGEGSATAVYVTHDQDEAAVMADDIAIINEGRIVRSGPAERVLSAPTDDWVASFIGMRPPVRGTVAEISEGLARVEVDGTSLYGMTDLPLGAEVDVSVRPEDVLIFPSDADVPRGSARNQLEAEVVEVTSAGTTVRVVIRAGRVELAAAVSRASAAELGLAEGVRVIALFKATATHVTETHVTAARGTPRGGERL
jgi:molybdopterin-binding protein